MTESKNPNIISVLKGLLLLKLALFGLPILFQVYQIYYLSTHFVKEKIFAYNVTIAVQKEPCYIPFVGILYNAWEDHGLSRVFVYKGKIVYDITIDQPEDVKFEEFSVEEQGNGIVIKYGNGFDQYTIRK